MSKLDNEKELLSWSDGATESLIIAVIMFFTFGIFVFLADFEELLTSPTTILYIILLMFGFATNIGALIEPKIQVNQVLTGLGYGALCFMVLMVIGLIFNTIPGFTLLETPPPPEFELNVVQRIAYQLSFVAIAEELIFRNTLPRYLMWVMEPFDQSPNKKYGYAMLAASFGISSVLFGLVHFIAYGFNPVQILIAIIAGVILSVFRVVSNNLLTCVVAHLLYNVVNITVFSLSPILQTLMIFPL